MNTSESIKNVIKALAVACSKMNNVRKTSENPYFSSNYADINVLRAEAVPLLQEQGLLLLQPPTNRDGVNFIETIIIHVESGEFLSSLNEVIFKANDPQSYLAAQTYTRRGALQSFLNMGAVDDDGNSASGKSNGGTGSGTSGGSTGGNRSKDNSQSKTVSTEYSYILTGKTYDIRAELKSDGWKFDNELKVYVMHSNNPDLSMNYKDCNKKRFSRKEWLEELAAYEEEKKRK